MVTPDVQMNFAIAKILRIKGYSQADIDLAVAARTAADEFLARKFVVGAVANTEAGYRGVAAVISGAAGQSAAFTVQRNLPGSDYFQDGRQDGSVDVILSQDYRSLAPPELVDQTPGTLSCPRESRRVADDDLWPVMPSAAPGSWRPVPYQLGSLKPVFGDSK